jgi:hypothetical protein
MKSGDIFGLWYLSGNLAGIWLGLKVQLQYNLKGGLLIWFITVAPLVLGILIGYLHCEHRKKKSLFISERN